MSSGTSTERGPVRQDGAFEVWHFYVLLAMIAATAGVVLSSHTHPAALLLLSGAVIAAGLVGLAMHHAMTGFVAGDERRTPLREADREVLEREKALTLRSIKELEFDRAMGKVSDRDFAEVESTLRAHALTVMEELDRMAAESPADPVTGRAGDADPWRADTACAACQTPNDPDARFCKQCGARL
jgi:hypothetical protein